jgi:hypothetical protein
MNKLDPSCGAIDMRLRKGTSAFPDEKEAYACFMAAMFSAIGKAWRTSFAFKINMLIRFFDR